jgi:hypothetical protein
MVQGGAGFQTTWDQHSRFPGSWYGKLDGLPVVFATNTRFTDRVRTGCVYEAQPTGTFGLLVTRDDPRTRRRGRPVIAPIHEHWPLLAPSIFLLTGHTTTCQARHCRSVGRCEGHRPQTLGWPDFAVAYRAELEQRPLANGLAVMHQIIVWLSTNPTVTVLSFESGMPRGEAFVGCEQRDELVPWAQRHIFRDWLVSLLPLAPSLDAARLNVPAFADASYLPQDCSSRPDQ